MATCITCGYVASFTPTGQCPKCRPARDPNDRLTTLKRSAYPSDEVHSADGHSFLSWDSRKGWEVVVEGASDSFHPTREQARVSIRAWKVKREAGTTTHLTESSFLAICKLQKLRPTLDLKKAVVSRGIRIDPSTTRYDLLSIGGLDID